MTKIATKLTGQTVPDRIAYQVVRNLWIAVLRVYCRMTIEGRDIGSVVFPDAALKLSLTASPRTRAERRVAEAGGDVDEIERSIAARDHHDSNRSDSPLVTADGSIVVDTTGMGIDEVLAHIQTLMNDGTDET